MLADRQRTVDHLAEAREAGYTAVALTVDLPYVGRRERDLRLGFENPPSDLPLAYAGAFGTYPALTWRDLEWLRAATDLPLVLKGILTREDATLAVKNGMDGIIVSNHGARSEDSGRSTIDALPEIVAAVGGKMPVLVDSGFRRGTDICKALALGANAVCVGRPYIWGLGAFGQPGVEGVLSILRTELYAIMQQVGAPTIKDLKPAMVRRAGATPAA